MAASGFLYFGLREAGLLSPGSERVIIAAIASMAIVVSTQSITKTALGSEESVGWEHVWDPQPVLEDLRSRGYEIAAIETSIRSVDLFDWQPRFPVCVLFGHEVDGLRPELAAGADAHVRIPMLGQKHSLNVASAGAVAVYELLRKGEITH